MKRSKKRDEMMKLLSVKDYHPTAEQLHSRMRESFPSVGIATVYRNLEQLRSMGIIDRIDVKGLPSRYDGNVEKHHHILCSWCGRIDDVFLDLDIKKDFTDFELIDYTIEFEGVCKDCSNLEVEGIMEKETKVINAMKKSAQPMRPGEIAAAAGLDKDDVTKVIGKLKKEGKVYSPKRCFYELS